MLWYKGWLETRFKLFMALGFAGLWPILFYSLRSLASAPGAKPAAAFGLTGTVFVVMTYTWLAGAGINTQPSFQAAKGLHGSTLFTLSLPVSRLRLLAVRSILGWLEVAGAVATFCCGMWLVVPIVRGSVTPKGMLEYVAALLACASSLYSLSVLLATVLDDLWRMWSGMIAFGALWALSNFALLPASVDIIRAMMGKASPLVAHTMPWTAMAFSVGLAAILFFAALKIVQRRQY